MTEWYSDRALQQQAKVQRYLDLDEQPPLALLVGIMEPRTQPTDVEKCHHCGGDGRDGAGGEERHGVRWCSLCLGRGRDEDYEAS